MTRIALEISSASQRLALRRWLEARGDEVCAADAPDADLILGPEHLPVPLLDGPDGTRIDFAELAERLSAVQPAAAGLVELGRQGPVGLIAQSEGMADLVRRIDRLADATLPVLIRGESGSGKERVARALHDGSARAGEPFVAVNCAAIPEGLFESELFGHEKGSFTDAARQRRGHFERTAGGTLFLDEIAELPGAVQAKLLRVLQERSFTRVGGEEQIPFSGRVVSATARDLAADPDFRPDLFHRISGAVLRVPPLRERTADLPELCAMILGDAESGPSRVTHYESGLLDALAARDWPGNVRQLENLLRQAAIFAEDGILRVRDLAGVVDAAGPDPDFALRSALVSWVRYSRGAGSTPAELREGLLERLREAESALESPSPDATPDPEA